MLAPQARKPAGSSSPSDPAMPTQVSRSGFRLPFSACRTAFCWVLRGSNQRLRRFWQMNAFRCSCAWKNDLNLPEIGQKCPKLPQIGPYSNNLPRRTAHKRVHLAGGPHFLVSRPQSGQDHSLFDRNWPDSPAHVACVPVCFGPAFACSRMKTGSALVDSGGFPVVAKNSR